MIMTILLRAVWDHVQSVFLVQHLRLAGNRPGSFFGAAFHKEPGDTYLDSKPQTLNLPLEIPV